MEAKCKVSKYVCIKNHGYVVILGPIEFYNKSDIVYVHNMSINMGVTANML